SGKGSSGDIKPSVLQSTLHEAHPDASGNAYKDKSYSSTRRPPVGKRCNRIEHDSAQSRADHAANHAVGSLLGGLSDDSVYNPTGCAKSHPGDATHNPDGWISERLRPRLVADPQPGRVDDVRHQGENEPENDSEGKRQNPPQQRLLY